LKASGRLKPAGIDRAPTDRNEQAEPRRREYGYVPLALVALGWLTLCIGIGGVLLYGGGLIALVIVIADAQQGRRVSRPALAALVGSLSIVLVIKLAHIV